MFSSDRDSNREIYSMSADGTHQQRLTNNAAFDYQPAWSPDGSRIAFTSSRDNDGDPEIFVMNADGTNPVQLTFNTTFDDEPSWSPDGTKIAYINQQPSGVREIYTMSPDGSGKVNVTNNGGFNSAPNWSPDGSKIAYHSGAGFCGPNCEVMTMDADGTHQTNITNNAASDSHPAWSPDGKKIAFASNRETSSGGDIYAVSLSDGVVSPLTQNTVPDGAPDWQPLPNHPPKVDVPADMTVEGNTTGGATIDFIATASDSEDGSITPTCDPASGGFFPIGTTTVECTATDSGGLTDDASFAVTVADTTPPALSDMPGDKTVIAESAAGANVNYAPPNADDVVDETPGVSCDPASGSLFPLGETTVTCTAGDASGNESTAAFKVTVNFDYYGFFAPVDMNDVVNVVKGGSTVPLRFSIHAAGGGYISDLAAVADFKVYSVGCDLADPTDPIEVTTTGATSLRYDYDANQFIQNWKTPKETGCKKVLLTLTDGSTVIAYFRLK